jgi:hypothetical protein
MLDRLTDRSIKGMIDSPRALWREWSKNEEKKIPQRSCTLSELHCERKIKPVFEGKLKES